MNRKKHHSNIYNIKETSEEMIKHKSKINDNYIQKSHTKIDHKAYFVKKPKRKAYNDKTKLIIENSFQIKNKINSNSDFKKENLNKNEENNEEINKVNETPKKRKYSNNSINSNNKNDNDDDLVTSFEKKPSELKSPKTISEDSFTSSYEKEEKQENKKKLINKDKNEENQIKNEYNELIYIDKLNKEINNDIKEKIKEEENIKNIEIKSKTTTTKGKSINNDKNNKKTSNLKITVNKTPRESFKNKEEKMNDINIRERKEGENKNDNICIEPSIEIEDNNKKEKLLLTNIKAVKQKKYFIQTEDKANRYKKKYINFTRNKNNDTKDKIKKEKKIGDEANNNKNKNNNKIEISNKDDKIPQKKNNNLLNKIKSNKFGLKLEDSNKMNMNTDKNQSNVTLSRNISFHNNSKNFIYAPKKLISSAILKSPQNNEISNISLSDKIKEIGTSIKNNNNKININEEHNSEQKGKKFIELKNNNNKIIFDNKIKYNNNFFDENNFNINFDNNDKDYLRPRYSISNLYYDNDIRNNLLSDPQNIYFIQNEQMINLLGNKILTSINKNLNNSIEDINNYNNIYLQNLFQYNFKTNNNNKMNNNSSLNSFSINFEDLIILQNYLQEMIISLSKNKPIQNECFEFWNYYYNSSLLTQIEKIFLNQVDSAEVKLSIYYSLMSIMLSYDYSFEKELFIKAIVSLIDLLKLNYKNLILICEYILQKISKESIGNIWVFKLSAIVKESKYNDYTSQILKAYNMTLVEKISYNTNIILQNLRYLLKNIKTKKNGILTGIFKKIKEKSYEEINIFFRENIFRISNINGSILGSIFLLKNTNFRPVPNPYVRTKNNKEYSLVLDLDETLIHFKPQNNGEDGGILRVRPGINEFLDEIGKLYELIVFTTATQDYADVLIDAIEEDKIYFEHRFYREHSTIIDNDFVKDLSRIGRPLDKIIIVDNMPQNFRLQKENGIIIKAFWGEDNTDTALYELIPILVNIAKEGGDVRKGLVKYKNEIIKKVTSCFSKNG